MRILSEPNPFWSEVNCANALFILSNSILDSSLLGAQVTSRIDVLNPGLLILFSIPSKLLASTLNFAFSGSASFFLVLETYFRPIDRHLLETGETTNWITAPSPSPSFAKDEVIWDIGSTAKSRYTLIG